MVEIRTAAEQLAVEQQERATSATRVEQLVVELDSALADLAATADDAGAVHAAVTANGAVKEGAPAENGHRPGPIDTAVMR
jgi:hypothetical protein